MYAQEQTPATSHVISGDGGGVSAESIDHYQTVGFEDCSNLDCLGAAEVPAPPDGLYGSDGVFHDGVVMQRGGGVFHDGGCDVSNQLTLSFRGQVFVFDSVTTEKVQAVLSLLGGREYTPGVDMAYQNQKGLMDNSGRRCDPKRMESLNRFRKKRKERCYEKKIRYNVRQEVALRMQRRKGQFAPKISEESAEGDISEDSGPSDSMPETTCMHCGTSSKATPMMRRGPAGPRTLCNACGLVWATKGTLRDLSKKFLPAVGECEDNSDSDYGIPIGPYATSLSASNASVLEAKH